MKLSEWNEGWAGTDEPKQCHNHTSVNGDYRIVYTGRCGLHGTIRSRVVYYKDERLAVCLGMQSGFSYARRKAYQHWKRNNK